MQQRSNKPWEEAVENKTQISQELRHSYYTSPTHAFLGGGITLPVSRRRKLERFDKFPSEVILPSMLPNC